jgi:hypothetical protein
MFIYDTRIPYTYLVGWSTLDVWYYGVRYAKKCHPDDLWSIYFTSSKRVATIRKKYGEPDIIQVRKIFSNPEAALLWEQKVLRRLKVIKNKRWLNQSVSSAHRIVGVSLPGILNPMYGKTPWNKGLTKETSPILKKVGEKISSTKSEQDYSSENNSFFGKNHTEEAKKKMRKPRKNKGLLGKHKRSDSQRNFNKNQMLELHKRKKACENCGKIFDPGNHAKHIRRCFSEGIKIDGS